MSTRLPLGWNRILESLPNSESVPVAQVNSRIASPIDPNKQVPGGILEDRGSKISHLGAPATLFAPHFAPSNTPYEARTTGELSIFLISSSQ